MIALSASVWLKYGVAIAGILIAALALDLVAERINTTTVALGLLLLILCSATFLGRNPALVSAFVAMLCFNYLFLPPVGTWHISEPQNLVAWAAFTITAIIAGELSAYARRRANEAERLYQDLQAAFQTATEVEAHKQSEKLKSALLDAVTHDLRTPLTSIKASVTTLLDSEGGHRTIELDGNGRKEFLDIINEETDRLNKFIEGMVELARVESSVGVRDASSAIEEIVSLALDRSASVSRGHRTVVKMEPGLPRVQGDERAFAEVIYNLIENSVKYSPAGSSITIRASRQGQCVILTVDDQGKGIPNELRERVFEKFVRNDDARSAGMGLGLAIARGIVEAQQGTISIETGDHGVGTKVIIKMPVVATDE